MLAVSSLVALVALLNAGGVAEAASAASGKLTCLAMNVAGLPSILQSNDVPGDKATNAGIIGSYFAKYGYDLINMQEDFNYHAQIYAADNHPYRTPTSGGAGVGSGLNSVSNFPFDDFTRVKWDKCNGVFDSGNDCLTPKGFTFMRVFIDEGVNIDVYNLHADADTNAADEVARAANLKQVADYIDANSNGNAVLVFGDTNSRYTRPDDHITVFRTQNGMKDAWVEVVRGGVEPTGTDALVCAGNPSAVNTCEVVDKLFYRGNPMINLTATSFEYAGAKFLQPDGNVTSDHDPVLVGLQWQLSSFRQSNLWGGPHGTWFTDLAAVPPTAAGAAVKTITFRGGSRVDNVAVTLASGATLSHGGTGGTAVSLALGAGEAWTATTLCQGQKDGHTRIFYIKATTSSGRTLQAGATTSDCVTYNAPAGYGVAGFYGSSGDEVDRVGLIYVPRA
ncbi:endonuclease/Exonuclease/phosphatase [Zopfochytrium polystomum]|nr:endonuclease/Exonuclease/phosphatase [Zopfochytrium polystomum]